MAESEISRVKNNIEKQQTYKSMISRYNLAVKYGFYCEAIMIAYAMIEDRLRSMIYHMGFLSNRDSVSICKKTKPFLQNCVDQYKDKEDTQALSVKKLSEKIKIIKCVYRWAAGVNGGYESDMFSVVLKKQIEGSDIEDVLHTLDRIEIWKGCRNEVTHGMLNKNIDSLEKILEPHAIEGMRLARSLDSQERQLKRGNRIRRRINLPLK